MHLVQKPVGFGANADLGKTIENISKIEGHAEGDNSEFFASYLGKDNRSVGKQKEQRAFSIQAPGTPGGITNTQGRDSAMQDFNIRDGSAMSNSERKNL